MNHHQRAQLKAALRQALAPSKSTQLQRERSAAIGRERERELLAEAGHHRAMRERTRISKGVS